MLTTNTYKSQKWIQQARYRHLWRKAENFPREYERRLENNWLISGWWYLIVNISWFNLWIDIIFITLKMEFYLCLYKVILSSPQRTISLQNLCVCLWVHTCVCIEIENWIFIFKVCFIKLKQLTKYTILSQFSCIQLFATLWTVAHQAPLSMGYSKQEY